MFSNQLSREELAPILEPPKGAEASASGTKAGLEGRPPERPLAAGKFLWHRGEKFVVRGVSYGAFRPDDDKREYWDVETIDRDFRLMAEAGMNTVRIPHTMPPRSLLDCAAEHGLMVMVGLSAEQSVGYLIDEDKMPGDLDEQIRAKVLSVAGHPALLCYGLGNEIPAALARWIGRRKIEQFLHRFSRIVRRADPEGLVTYVNYPSTEYLHLPFLDFVSFNVYLERQEDLRRYLYRLHSIAGDRPLLMSEVGLDALRNGEETQADVLDWQIRTIMGSGCAGSIVFSWTDEWFRGGAEVDDWEFGLTRRDRSPKPALAAVSRAYDPGAFLEDAPLARFSVIVCTYNGASTLRECLNGILALDYPDYEVIVVNDGSRDDSESVALSFGGRIRLITTENRGLANARNTGMQAATGELIAYIDDDAFPDVHWLRYLARAFAATSHSCIGGPNIPPTDECEPARCVANAPGGPLHVLLDDETAEHLPGCNMAFRKADLEAVGGFDPQFTVAGDDVDVCWRLMSKGWTLGFHPGAMVWHRRRASVRRYFRQQIGYGRAEALLEAKWPEKYNDARHIRWAGRVYGNGVPRILGNVSRVYHGPWGSAPFQQLHAGKPPTVGWLMAMPEWWLVLVSLAALFVLGLLWTPLFWVAAPLLASATVLTAVQTYSSVRDTRLSWLSECAGPHRLRMLGMVAMLHFLQPAVRLYGRVRYGLGSWRCTPRSKPVTRFILPRVRHTAKFTRTWIDPYLRLATVENALTRDKLRVVRGGEFDRWDFQVEGGMMGGARMIMAVEDQGSGTQYVRIKTWPTIHLGSLVVTCAFLIGAAAGFLDGAHGVASILTMLGAALGIRAVHEATRAQAKLAQIVAVTQSA